MSDGIGSFLRISPAVWPGRTLDVQPGDLARFAPMGNGLARSGPLPMFEGDEWEDAERRTAFYDFHPHSAHPFAGAPRTEAEGGAVYFDDGCRPDDLAAIWRLLGLRVKETDYAAFVHESQDPYRDRYVTQLRIVSQFAMRHLYGALERDEQLPTQPLALGDALAQFVTYHQEEFEAGRYDLTGTLGGDGDWAYESLAFGFLVENAYHHVYRIWTRPWLITK